MASALNTLDSFRISACNGAKNRVIHCNRSHRFLDRLNERCARKDAGKEVVDLGCKVADNVTVDLRPVESIWNTVSIRPEYAQAMISHVDLESALGAN
jgi:hypothetical protein